MGRAAQGDLGAGFSIESMSCLRVAQTLANPQNCPQCDCRDRPQTQTLKQHHPQPGTDFGHGWGDRLELLPGHPLKHHMTATGNHQAIRRDRNGGGGGNDHGTFSSCSTQ